MNDLTLPKFKSKSEAEAAFREDLREWQTSYFAEAETYVNELTSTISAVKAGDDDQAKLLMAAVALHVPKEPGLGDMSCITCVDPEEWQRAEWPCQTFTVLGQALNLPGVAELGTGPKMEDYWTDPFVTVTLAKSARVTMPGDRLSQHLHRGAQVTIALSEAIRIKPQLVPTSQARVEAKA